MYSGQYTGTGTYGEDNPTTVTFPFAASIIFIPYISTTRLNSLVPRPLFAAQLSTTSWTSISSGNARHLYAKVSADNKTYYWCASRYNSNYTSEAIANQYNTLGVTYYYVGFGNYDTGGQTEWILTSTQTWTVPRTGKYYIELYGGGGGANMYSSSSDGSCTGGSSCQTYDSIQLTINQQINVIIGEAGKSNISQTSTSGGSTTFGTYTVSGGTRSFYGLNRNQYYYSLGSGARNKGTSGQSGWGLDKINPNTGTYRSVYRYGGYSYNSGNNARYLNGGPRAVYLKYLGT